MLQQTRQKCGWEAVVTEDIGFKSVWIAPVPEAGMLMYMPNEKHFKERVPSLWASCLYPLALFQLAGQEKMMLAFTTLGCLHKSNR